MRLLREIIRKEGVRKEGKTIYREAVRGIILSDNKLLLIYSSRNGDYKFPGGGVLHNETYEETLSREVKEESGASVSAIEGEFGKVIEYGQPEEPEYVVFKMASYCYACSVDRVYSGQNLEGYEKDLDFKPVWVDIDTAIKANKAVLDSSREIPPWIVRETFVLEQVKKQLLHQNIVEESEMDNRKNWTRQQDQLRKLISARAHFEQAVQLFLAQHAAVHTAKISGSQAWSLLDDVLAGLTDEQIRTRLRPGTNSIAWLLWHTTRIEDMTINSLVLEQPQILNAEWFRRLGLPLRDCGSSMDDGEVADFSAQVSVKTLKDYRAAVGRSTRAGVPRLHAAQLKEVVPTASVQKLVDEGSISVKGGWLAEYYTDRTKGFFLTRTATSHNFIHLNEAGRIRAKLERS